MTLRLRPPCWPRLLAATALVGLVFLVFWPIAGFEFVGLDVYQQVHNNPRIRGLDFENLTHIFATSGSGGLTPAYYPPRSLTYAIDFQIWGLNPGGFKLTNLLIHSSSVLLLFWLIFRLFRRADGLDQSNLPQWDVLIAAFATSLFAIHPVVVEPVTWVAGREELLMTLGALGCLHFHLTARQLRASGRERRRRQVCHICAVVCCLFACLSNAVGAIIPALITAWDLLTRRKRKIPRIVWDTSALWLIALTTIVVKKLGAQKVTTSLMDMEQAGRLSAVIQKFDEGGDFIAGEIGTFTVERLMMVLNIYGLNVKTLLWPNKLAVGRLPVTARSLGELDVLLGAAALALTCLAIWLLRRQKLILFGLVWFGLALGPSSQIMPHHVHQADRFLYLPLVGLAVVAALGLRPLANVLRRRVAVGGVIVAGLACLLLLHLLSARQVQTWRNTITMWQNCVDVNPDHFLAHRQLVELLDQAGQVERAASHRQEVQRISARNVEALNRFARHLATCDDKKQRDYQLAIKLAKWAEALLPTKNPQTVRTLAMAYNSFGSELAGRGEFTQAINHYNQAIAADPAFGAPFINLALLLATCDDPTFRREDEAVRLAEKARSLQDEPDARNLMVLSMTYASAGQMEQAIGTAKQALQLAKDQGDAQLADQLRNRLELYQGVE